MLKIWDSVSSISSMSMRLIILLLSLAASDCILFPTPLRLSSRIPSSFPKQSLLTSLRPGSLTPPLPQTSSSTKPFQFTKSRPGIETLKQFTQLLSQISTLPPLQPLLIEDKSDDARLQFLQTYEILDQLDCCDATYHTSGKSDVISLTVTPTITTTTTATITNEDKVTEDEGKKL